MRHRPPRCTTRPRATASRPRPGSRRAGPTSARRPRRASRPLHAAARRDAVPVVRVLLEHGADVGAQDVGGDTPLHRAASGDAASSAALLLDRGADTAARANDGVPPLHVLDDGHRRALPQSSAPAGRGSSAALGRWGRKRCPRGSGRRGFRDEEIAGPDPPSRRRPGPSRNRRGRRRTARRGGVASRPRDAARHRDGGADDEGSRRTSTMTWVRSHAERLAGAARFDDTTDVHVHLAEAARWKDGPSAGGGAGRRPGLGADRTAGAGGRGHERGADARGGRSSRSAASGRRCWGRAGRGWRP